jgi:hypothetical protein
MHPIAATPFHIRRPAEAETGVRKSIHRCHDIRGIARRDGERLVLEWSGVVRVPQLAGGDGAAVRPDRAGS